MSLLTRVGGCPCFYSIVPIYPSLSVLFSLSVHVCLSVCLSVCYRLPIFPSLLGGRLVEVLPHMDKPFQNYAVQLVKEMMADGVVALSTCCNVVGCGD